MNFYLVNCWGDAIPLITTPDVELNRAAKSVPRQQVYDQMLTDLQQAQDLLTGKYEGSGRVRANAMAAKALLARCYLYQGNYNDAITQASAVIGSNLYGPLPSPDSAFLQSSSESIWQLMLPNNFPANGQVGDAYLYLSTSDAISLQPPLLKAFEPGDLRQQSWVITVYNPNTLITRITANKYKRRDGGPNNTPYNEYYTVLRLAEQYLIRAEAYTRLGQTQAAIADLNVIRTRAGLKDLPITLTQHNVCLRLNTNDR